MMSFGWTRRSVVLGFTDKKRDRFPGAPCRGADIMTLGSVERRRCGAHRMKNAALPQALTARARTVAPDDDEPGNNAAYDEYLRGFDDIPVLQDAVRIPPPRRGQPDFRRGERRDVRQEQRPDAYSLREAMLAEIEFLYHEHTQPAPVVPRPKRKTRQKRKSESKTKPKSKAKKG